jgi:ABC-type bacteriocin/lantibiotic exporter with double-glycine peptidase domain
MFKKILQNINILVEAVKSVKKGNHLIILNFIASFFSFVGLPLLVLAYQYDQTNRDDLNALFVYFEKIYRLLNIEPNFYSLMIGSLIIIIFGQSLLSLVEVLNRYFNIELIKKNSINLIEKYKNSLWLKIADDRSGKFQYANNVETLQSSQVVLDSLRLSSYFIQLFFFIIGSFIFSPKITLITLVLIIILSIITLFFSLKINSLSHYFNISKIEVSNSIANINNNKKYIKSSYLPFFFQNVYNQIYSAWNIGWKSHIYHFILNYIIFLLVLLYFFFILVFYREFGFKLENVSIAILIFFRLVPVFIKMQQSYSSLNENTPIYKNFNKRIEYFGKYQEKIGKKKYLPKSIIKFKNVFYKYPNNKYILKNINLAIKPNKTLVITGPSGSGKSTLVDLIIGLIKPNKGDIIYGNIKQKNLDIISFRKKISYISQNVSLFDGTIKDNLVMGSEKKHSEIIKACRLTKSLEFINSMPKKFKTRVGENGIKISGGQKQRILLARALLSNSEIIILDEATNQIDDKLISYIGKTLNKIKFNRTIIIISHQNKVKKLGDYFYNLKN